MDIAEVIDAERMGLPDGVYEVIGPCGDESNPTLYALRDPTGKLRTLDRRSFVYIF